LRFGLRFYGLSLRLGVHDSYRQNERHCVGEII